MKKLISLFLVFSILVLSGNVFAKERKGADLIIQKTDGTGVRGELIAVKQNSLLLLERESGADVTVDIGDIKMITIVKKSKFRLGAGLGGLLGIAIGAIATSPEEKEVSEPMLAPAEGIGAIFNWLGLVTIIALFGSLTGGAIGAALGTDKIIQIEGKSDSEIQEILEKLRKKARVKNSQ